ncbi:glutaredoxin-related protein 5, mitochondrial-like [Physella acuta]|uniref:glutaredoxin-related protein 5, mitochondrial-like n=1 Tax=Physella acuta TaxID=109671 RepID=UPI0027DE4D3E|nr:glutaredoxin-related protein 5, mitochondrial-like [Physella acuta]
MNKFGAYIFNKNIQSACRFNFVRVFSQQKKYDFDELVKGKKIVVFMKGTPEAPRCGFSNAVCQILKFHGVNKFESFDVLSDDELREGIKKFTNWPTIPQVFFNGEFVGGCDIMLDMHKNGDLIEELKKVGIRSVLLDSGDDSSISNKKS